MSFQALRRSIVLKPRLVWRSRIHTSRRFSCSSSSLHRAASASLLSVTVLIPSLAGSMELAFGRVLLSVGLVVVRETLEEGPCTRFRAPVQHQTSGNEAISQHRHKQESGLPASRQNSTYTLLKYALASAGCVWLRLQCKAVVTTSTISLRFTALSLLKKAVSK